MRPLNEFVTHIMYRNYVYFKNFSIVCNNVTPHLLDGKHVTAQNIPDFVLSFFEKVREKRKNENCHHGT